MFSHPLDATKGPVSREKQGTYFEEEIGPLPEDMPSDTGISALI